MNEMTNKVKVFSMSQYKEWKSILEECGVKHRITNMSDYSGLEILIEWAE